jgi:flagellar hook assembly protein FlgD
MSTITNINNNTPPATTPTASGGGQTLTQADFLKIMVAQFTQQDPLSSSDGSGGGSGTSDYINQLMSMTNLTTEQTMSKQQAQMLAASLPGETVDVNNNGVHTDGVVQSARVDSSDLSVYFTVGGTEYPSSDLYAINQTVTTPTTPSTTTPTTTN